LDDRTAVPFVSEACRAAAQQAGNDAFNHRSAVPTRVGKMHLCRGPDSLQARLAQDPGDVLRGGRRGQGSTALGIPTVRIPRSCQTWS
jgi:hypothetical protein